MKWINSKERNVANIKALSLSLLSLGLVALWILFFINTPNKVSKVEKISVNGDEFQKNNPSPLDSLLKQPDAYWIYDAINLEKIDLKNDEKLFRFGVGKSNLFWAKLLNYLKDKNITVFWKEVEENLSYRILYVKNKTSSINELKSFLSSNPGLGKIRGVVEKPVFKDDKVFIEFVGFEKD